MDFLVITIVIMAIVAFAIVGQLRGWVDLSSSGSKQRRSGGGAPLGAIDEIFNPTRYETQLEADRQSVLPAPAPTPGDGDKDVYKGNVKIQLPPTR